MFKYLFSKKRKNRDIDKFDIEIEDVEKILKTSYGILVDVRSPKEYEEGHMEGAILIPEYEINKKVKEMLPDKEKVVIVYCSSGVRSKKAKEKLKNMGYKYVYNLYNGYQNY